MEIQVKRVYEKPQKGDGRRILVDRLWPRGLSREGAKIDRWAKEVSPSHELRKWYGHDPAKWDEFERRYARELDAKTETIEALLDLAARGQLTLVYSAKNEAFNQAVALRDYLLAKAQKK